MLTSSAPCVIDVYHGDGIYNMSQMKKAGIVGLIHKATQGDGSHDPAYALRRALWMNGEPALVDGKEVAPLWGAYHFNTGDNIDTQVANFFSRAEPDDHTLMALDFEDNRASNMTISQAFNFLMTANDRLKRRLVLYSGNRLKDLIGQATLAQVQFLSQHRLWIPQYGPRVVTPRGFSKWWLWQKWADGYGPKPIPAVPGVYGHPDLNVYEGTVEALAAEWAAGVDVPVSHKAEDAVV